MPGFIPLPLQHPGFQDFQSYMVSQIGANAIEVVNVPLRDSILYPTAGLTAASFFSNGVGQGATSQSGQTGVKTAGDVGPQSALNANGQLAAPNGYFATHMELEFLPGSVSTAATWTYNKFTNFAAANAATVQSGEDDARAVLSTGVAVLTVNGRNYVDDAPLEQFVPMRQQRLDSSQATTSATAGEMTKAVAWTMGEPYPIVPGMALQFGVSFNVNLAWPAVVATPSGFNGKIICRLRGYLFRSKGS